MAPSMSDARKEAVGRVAGLVLTNAMIFQEVLSGFDRRVPSLTKSISENPIRGLWRDWKFIVEKIDYYPIFNLAREIIENLSSTPFVVDALENLAFTAQDIVRKKAALRHDLMGRVYHRLLAEKKYLATYYTSVPAATILLKLALRPDAWRTDWGDLDVLAQLSIADLACGTGTLLMAAGDAITDNYIAARAGAGQPVETDKLHAVLAERIVHGYDVLSSAIHLTASTLAMKAPHVPFDRTNLYRLPHGGDDLRLGSIEFLEGKQVQSNLTHFTAAPAQRMGGNDAAEVDYAGMPQVDLCVMNPPFTRSVGGNLLFGSLPDAVRRKMQKKLAALLRRKSASASSTAGLGAVFVAAADPYVKPGGRLALVLPKAVLSGVSWAKTRELLRRNYRVEYVVVSYEPDRWNFSESTSLSETLIIAVKTDPARPDKESARTVAVNLWRNPRTSFEAQAVAHGVLTKEPPDLVEGQGAVETAIGEVKFAETVSILWERLRGEDNWLLPCAFAQSDLVRAGLALQRGELWLPGKGRVRRLRLCGLGDIGQMGPDVRDIRDGFSLSKGPTSYPAFSGHDSRKVVHLHQQPNTYLIPLARRKKGRPLRRATDLWPLAGNLLLAERLRLNTHRVCAVRASEKVLSGTSWWPLSLKRGVSNAAAQKAIVAWLNSSLGLLLLFARRVETQGAWVKFKKPILAAMPVLDLRGLKEEQLGRLATAFDRTRALEFLPFPRMDEDDARKELDRAVCKALGVPDISPLRRMLAREPIVSLKPL